MKIVLEKKESEKVFYSALCDGLGTLNYIGLELTYNEKEYKLSKEALQNKIDKGEYPHEMYIFKGEKPTICYEDVLMEMIRKGFGITLEGEGYKETITLKDVHEKVQKTTTKHLMDAINEQGDAITAEIVLQTVFFGKEVFC